ncbi:MAG: BamA/TamA family outer membrane protein [Deltaproteobacteria bacterium]|nr:BamA/TamA family outer membrane protein [Deltaproteobacteria bacterium]
MKHHFPRAYSIVGVICIIAAVSVVSQAQDFPVEWQAISGDEGAEAAMEPVSIQEGPAVHYHLEKVVIKGNRKTLRSVILRYLEIRPGDLFAAEDSSLEESKYRLLATGLFRRVSFELKKGSARGYVVLEITVEERNTIVINDFTIGITQTLQDIDKIVPFGSIGVLERSFLGTGIHLGGQLAASDNQQAYRIYWRDDHFLNSRVGVHVDGLFAEAEEYFGAHFLRGKLDDAELRQYDRYSVVKYRRASIRLGTGYNLLTDYFFWCDFRFENILQGEPRNIEREKEMTASGADSQTRGTPYMEPDDSVLTSALFGFTRDTTNHPVLPSDGSLTRLSVELSHPLLGSSYEYVKFILSHRVLFPFGKAGQSLGIEGVAGLISGDAPFFEQFFVGDYSATVPDRKLGLNFTNLHPRVLDTAIFDMWYEDLVISLCAEWSRPIYRGSGNVYGINVFVRMGAFALTSARHLDGSDFPVDITGDFGLRIDTSIGVLSFSFASVLQLIPPIRHETTE